MRASWPEVELGEVCTFRYGKSLAAADRDGGPFPVYGSNGVIGSHSESVTTGATIVIGRKGSVGEVAYSESPCWPIDTTYFVDTSATTTDLKWLSHRLKDLRLTRLNRAAAIPGLNRDDAYRQRLLLPPIDEQRRIAAILDQADGIRAKRRQVLAHLDTLTQSIFYETFGDPDAAVLTVPFRDVAGLCGGRNLVANDSKADSPYRVLKISAVTSGEFKASETKPLPEGYEPPAGHLVRPGDLLMSRANTTELVGAVAYVREVPPNLALPDKVWRFDWRDAASVPVFYHALFRTKSIRRRISRLSSGSGGSMKNVSKAKLESLLLPKVSPKMQREFAGQVGLVNIQRAAVQHALAADDELFASLQARAFRGEL